MGTTRIPITDPIRTMVIMVITRLRSTGTADTAIITATIVTIGTIIAGNKLTLNQKNPISWLGSNFEPAFLYSMRNLRDTAARLRRASEAICTG